MKTKYLLLAGLLAGLCAAQGVNYWWAKTHSVGAPPWHVHRFGGWNYAGHAKQLRVCGDLRCGFIDLDEL